MNPASPWHEGERALHRALGVADRMEAVGPRVIREQMPEQHRAFYAQLPFLIVGLVDDGGSPWATILEGAPGFTAAPDPSTLRVGAALSPADPAAAGASRGAAVGVLGIELPSRRRNRLNGRIEAVDGAGLVVRAQHSFGNCPQYIHPRELVFARPPGPFVAPVDQGSSLDAGARATIARADTFFVASYADTEGGRQVDVSHRGGPAGFVRVDGDTLTVPDFSGNRFFNTLGNFLLQPRAGLLFLDLERGDVLQLTGRVEVALDDPEIDSFEGAERLWRFTTTRWVRRRGALALRAA